MSYTELSLLEFQRRFSTDQACQQALDQARWPNGFFSPPAGPARAVPALAGAVRRALRHGAAFWTAFVPERRRLG